MSTKKERSLIVSRPTSNLQRVSSATMIVPFVVCALAVLHLCYSVYEDRQYHAAAGRDSAYQVPNDVRKKKKKKKKKPFDGPHTVQLYVESVVVLLACVAAAAKFGPPWFDLAKSEHADNTYESSVMAESSPFASINHKRFVLSQKDQALFARLRT